jgi:hypothetical protein
MNTGKNLDECRLARAVLSKERVNLARKDFERYAAKSSNTGEGFYDVLQRQSRSTRDLAARTIIVSV